MYERSDSNLLWSEASICISSASRCGVFGGVAAIADFVGEGQFGTHAVVDVPEIAEVDTVVVMAGRLGAGVSSNGASILSICLNLSELEDLVVSVLLVLGKAGGPDVVVCCLVEEVVLASGGAFLWISVESDHIGHGAIEGVTALSIEVARDMAVSVLIVVRREVIFAASNSNGGEECKSSHMST